MAIQFERLTLADLPRLAEHLADWQQGDHAGTPRPVAERRARRLLWLGGAGRAWLIRIGGQAAGYVVVTLEGGAQARSARGKVAGYFLMPSLRGAPAERQVQEFLLSVGQWLGFAVAPAPLIHDSHGLPRFRAGDRDILLPPRTLHQATA